jgi:hypothetical protein
MDLKNDGCQSIEMRFDALTCIEYLDFSTRKYVPVSNSETKPCKSHMFCLKRENGYTLLIRLMNRRLINALMYNHFSINLNYVQAASR